VARRLLATALDRAHGNQSRAAEALGISRHQIRTRMRRYGLLGLVGLAVAAGAVTRAPARSLRPSADAGSHAEAPRPSTPSQDAPC
jgi:hypothetical protein